MGTNLFDARVTVSDQKPMKILMADNFYYVRGGAQRYFFELSELLESKGHEVIPFSVDYEKNLDTEYSKYFVKGMTYSDLAENELSIFGKIRTGLNSIYSFEAKKNIKKLIRTVKPDLIHTHSIPYRLTSSIINAANEEDIPVVHTCHEWKALCPNQRLFKFNPPGVCEKCMGFRFYNAVKERCIKNSLSGSIVGCTEAYLCHFNKIYSRKIDRFVAPSNFVKEKLVEYGFDSRRVVFIPYYINLAKFSPNYDFDNYILYYGHLTPQKGVKTLVSAMKGVSATSLMIIGDGELKEELKQMVATQGIKNVEFKDYLLGEEVFSYVSNAAFTVVPSIWYETAGLVIYESFALGKPVIGANIGPIPERVEDGVTGLLFEPGNVDELTDKINHLISRPDKIVKMGEKARQNIEEIQNSDFHYEKLMKVYQQVLANRRK